MSPTPRGVRASRRLADQGEDDGDFDDFCTAVREVGETCESNPRLAAHLAVLLNRAHALGMQSAGSTPAKG